MLTTATTASVDKEGRTQGLRSSKRAESPFPLSAAANHWVKEQSHSSEKPNTAVTAMWGSAKARETSYFPHRHSQAANTLCCAPVAEHTQW